MEADASLSAQALPPPLNNCVVFFEYCVRHKVICVPGIFFDVNPFHRRRFHKSPYIDKLRMSYGPAWPNLKMAVRRQCRCQFEAHPSVDRRRSRA